MIVTCRECGRDVLSVAPSLGGDGEGVSLSAELTCAGDRRRHAITIAIAEIDTIVVPPSPALADAMARRAELN